MAGVAIGGRYAPVPGGADVEVIFTVIAETQWGDQVWVAGATEELGAWSPCRALELHTDAAKYPCWRGRTRLPLSALKAQAACEYKFVITHTDGSVRWEQGSNRTLVQVGDRCPSRPSRFGEPDPPLEPYLEEPQESEASTSAEEDACSETPMSESMFSQLTLQPEQSSSNLSECLRIEETSSPAEKASLKAFRLSSGAFRMAKPWGHCEDSYFFGSRALGVADGVGEMARFADLGVDAAAYAADLMECSARYLEGADGCACLQSKGPKAAAVAAVAEAEEKAATYGASTIAVLAISSDGKSAGVANLGDSGFIHFRRAAWGTMEIAEKSREQEHAFNCPYQLCRVPEELGRRLAYKDTAALCAKYEVELQQGDMLLMYTDGLTDNLTGFEITNFVNSSMEAFQGRLAPELIAETLVRAAHERSLDPEADTPFFRTARRHRQHMPGGKADDITVVVGWVEPDEEAPGGGHAPGEVRVGGPHRAEAQSTLVVDATTMQRKATQSNLPDHCSSERMERKATVSLLPQEEVGEESLRVRNSIQRKATQTLLPDES